MNEAHDSKVVYLRLDDIIPNRFQPREVFDENGLQELSDSIKEHGVIQPIVVRPIGNKYELIAGERRTKASALAGKTTIPAIIRNMDDKESAKVSLLENLQRKNLSAIEEARTYKKIIELDNLTQEGLARTMGKSQPMVANKLRLLMLPDEVQDALMKNQISERHARSLLTLKSKKDQLKFLDKIRNERLTVRELDKELKKYKEHPDTDDEIEEKSNTSELDTKINYENQSENNREQTENLNSFNQDDIELSKEKIEEDDERSLMNNNRVNFGGMGLNDYQSGVSGNIYNNYPNNFNNMPNMNNNGNTQYNYNNFNVPDEGNGSQTNEYFSGMQPNQNLNNTSSLGSMFDGYNNAPQNIPMSNNNDSGLFVSHIREDNLPKVENQFLPNFDNFNSNNDSNNDGTREALNNFNQNNSFNNFSNQNEYGNFSNNGMINNNLNYSSNDFNNFSNLNNNGFNQPNMNDMNSNFNNQMNNNYFMNDLNANNQMNNMNNGYNINENNSIPDMNGGINTMYQPNQGAMFSQPLNIIDVPNNNVPIENEQVQENNNPMYQNNMNGMTNYNNQVNNFNNNMSNQDNGNIGEMNQIPNNNMPNSPSISSNEDNYNDMMSQPVNITQEEPSDFNFEFTPENETTNGATNNDLENNSNEIKEIKPNTEDGISNNLDDSEINENYVSNDETDDPYEAPKSQKDEYIRLEPVYTINTPMDAVMELKKTTDKIKQNHPDIETEEIEFDDVYQITIKIKKTDEII